MLVSPLWPPATESMAQRAGSSTTNGTSTPSGATWGRGGEAGDMGVGGGGGGGFGGAGGRELLAGLAWAGSPGEAFAQSAGATWGLNEIRRALDTDALRPERRDALRDQAQAASAGYSLVSWAGPVPEGHLDAVAVLNR